MELLLDYYSHGDEFEIRCNFSDEIILRIYDSLPNKQGMLQSVIAKNISKDTSVRRIETYKSVDGKIKREELKYDSKKIKYTKMKKISNAKVKFAISSETTLDTLSFSVRDNNLYCKLRWRESVTIDDWKYEFSVEAVMQNPDKLKQAIGKLIMQGDIRSNYSPGVTSLVLEIEYAGKSGLTMNKILDIVRILESYINVSGGSDIDWYYISSLINPYSKKSGLITSMNQIINKPEGLTKYMLSKLDIKKYYLTDKTDGQRCIAVLANKSFYATAMTMTHLSYSTDEVKVLDCELLDNIVYVFDILKHGNDYCIFDDFDTRWKILSNISLPDGFALKTMIRIEDPSQIISYYDNIQNTRMIDGLIFTPAHREVTYNISKRVPMAYYDDKIYKWKPPNMLTIDLYIMRPPSTNLKPFDKPCLVACCGITKKLLRKLMLITYEHDNREYIPIPFQSPINEHVYIINYEEHKQYIGKVCEFNVVDWALKFVRVREDKTLDAERGLYFGNDYMTSDLTYFSAINPIQLNEFAKPPTEYFHKDKPTGYKAISKNNNISKNKLMQPFIKKGNIVIDLASGLGQDLNKYNKMNVSTLICVDNSLNGLEELNNRKYNLINPMRLLIRQIDLTLDATKIINALDLGIIKADAVVINLAIHYIIKSSDALANFMRVINVVLNAGGYFIFSTFDGERVNAFIEQPPDTDKYQIQSLYDKYDNINKISVKHHFGESYEEYLLDGNWLKREIKKCGYILEKQMYFDEDNKLTDPIDVLYSSLYVGYVFRKA